MQRKQENSMLHLYPIPSPELKPRNQMLTLFEEPIFYEVNLSHNLNNEELVEQCVALVQAMIETNKSGIRESLMFILAEKLHCLQQRYP
ncbi:hypothetical protein RHO15_10530 [Utexia brackfieldae]|uniref:hypothetical protein n=1 Tax=Utexia brackfieldae TaxID=3074108 RepID=UPI00370D7E61